MSWESRSAGKFWTALQTNCEVWLNWSRRLEVFDREALLLKMGFRVWSSTKLRELRSYESHESESYEFELNTLWALKTRSSDLLYNLDRILIELLSRSLCATFHSLPTFEKVALGDICGRVWTKNLHPLHSESRLSKHLHPEEPVEESGRKICTICTWGCS